MHIVRKVHAAVELFSDLLCPVKINAANFQKAVWEAHSESAIKRLGTGLEARKTLRQILKAIGMLGLGLGCAESQSVAFERSCFYRHRCRDGSLHETALEFLHDFETTIEVIGDPKDVHYIIPPRHAYGYAIFTSRDGLLTMEVIEGRQQRIQVIRRRGRVIAVENSTMLRHEFSSGMKII